MASARVACCRRRRLVEDTLRSVAERAAGALVCAAREASRAIGAAGAGWALFAALRAAAHEASSDSRKDSKALSTDDVDHTSFLETGPIPKHVAVIMDGNRRFGRREHGDSLSGHKAGGEKLRDFVKWCSVARVQVLTVFAFSTENWKRDKGEVDAMMRLFVREVPSLCECTLRLNVSVRFLTSDAALLPADLREAMADVEKRTADCTGMRLNVCLSYGGRGDITRACQELVSDVAEGKLDPASIDEAAVSSRLLTGTLPDPDVLIRTSGERRLSNFMIFQLAYAEFFFLDKHWPEVSREDLLDILARYQARHRRYGA